MAEVFLVRQPIFDKTEAAVGYELRFRDPGDGSDAFARSFLSGAFEVLRGGLPAWVPMNRAGLDNDVYALPDPSSLVLLIPPDFPTDPAVLSRIEALSKVGVTFVLDEFERPTLASSAALAFLPYVKFVRIDLRGTTADEAAPLVAALKKQGKRVVADEVFDARVHTSCLAAGFDLMQGPHFARPEPLPSAELPTSSVAALRVMALARDPDVSEREIEKVISSDPGITFQLLRVVNSASVGGRGISSISHALRLAGRNNLVRWLALASYASRAGKSGVDDELARQAVRRAYLAEALSKSVRALDHGTAFLVGLFSLLDAVFRIPLHEVLERINLSDDVKGALLDREGPYAGTLQAIEAYELGLWESAAEHLGALGVSADRFPELYADSLRAAEELVPSHRTAVAA
ncbi:MAG: HDOD domain-containing protein [Proteobacteria bacterium]|nr:HDOD domain-containing protein [Pseudomonadota bacterium]